MLKSLSKRINNQKGMTLIELIIVVAIIGILAVIGITQFSGMTETAKENADVAMISEIESAGKLYIAEGNTIADGDGFEEIDLTKYIDPADIKFQSEEIVTNQEISDSDDVTFNTDGTLKAPTRP